MINTRLLKAKIVLHGYSMKDISKCLNITGVTLWRKINGKTEFKQSELLILAKLLDIQNINEIFYN